MSLNLKRIFIPRLEYIFLAAAFLGIVANGPKMLNLDGDLPRHILVGRQILAARIVPTVDTYSYRTLGFPAYPHEWLAQVLLALSDTIFGLDGVVLLTSILIISTFATVYNNAYRLATPLVSLIFTGLALSISTIHFIPRPHIFTYLFVAIWLFQIERIRSKDNRKWWIFPILMFFWVNIHGMFVIGLIILGAYIVGGVLDYGPRKWWQQSESRLLLVSGLTSLPVTFLSPSGSDIWKIILGLGSNSYITSRIHEYQSANFQHPGTWPFILLLVLLIAGLALDTNKRSWSHILLLAGFLVLALYSSRMISLFAIVSAPIASQVFSNWMKDKKPISKFLRMENLIKNMEPNSGGITWLLCTIFLIVYLLVSGHSIDPQRKGNTFDPKAFPVAAVDWLQSHPQAGNMINEFNWGGYILLKTWPKYPIFMDGHTHIFGEMLTREYEQLITTSPGWESIIDKYQATWAILPTTSNLASALSERGWETLYQDDTAIILKNTANQ